MGLYISKRFCYSFEPFSTKFHDTIPGNYSSWQSANIIKNMKLYNYNMGVIGKILNPGISRNEWKFETRGL